MNDKEQKPEPEPKKDEDEAEEEEEEEQTIRLPLGVMATCIARITGEAPDAVLGRALVELLANHTLHVRYLDNKKAPEAEYAAPPAEHAVDNVAQSLEEYGLAIITGPILRSFGVATVDVNREGNIAPEQDLATLPLVRDFEAAAEKYVKAAFADCAAYPGWDRWLRYTVNVLAEVYDRDIHEQLHECAAKVHPASMKADARRRAECAARAAQTAVA